MIFSVDVDLTPEQIKLYLEKWMEEYKDGR